MSEVAILRAAIAATLAELDAQIAAAEAALKRREASEHEPA